MECCSGGIKHECSVAVECDSGQRTVYVQLGCESVAWGTTGSLSGIFKL